MCTIFQTEVVALHMWVSYPKRIIDAGEFETGLDTPLGISERLCGRKDVKLDVVDLD